jgi:hypothetical protein
LICQIKLAFFNFVAVGHATNAAAVDNPKVVLASELKPPELWLYAWDHEGGLNPVILTMPEERKTPMFEVSEEPPALN